MSDFIQHWASPDNGAVLTVSSPSWAYTETYDMGRDVTAMVWLSQPLRGVTLTGELRDDVPAHRLLATVAHENPTDDELVPVLDMMRRIDEHTWGADDFDFDELVVQFVASGVLVADDKNVLHSAEFQFGWAGMAHLEVRLDKGFARVVVREWDDVVDAQDIEDDWAYDPVSASLERVPAHVRHLYLNGRNTRSLYEVLRTLKPVARRA